MPSLFTRVEALAKAHRDGGWGERITAELRYLERLSHSEGGQWDALLGSAAALVEGGGVDEARCREAEALLAPLAPRAKAYTLLCCSHSHIDLNFLWGYDETVSVVLATFSTMLRLLEEFPDFVYSQSQAAAYRIAERYDPALIGQIREQVRLGRWEVTASAWVEADKNMPSGESQARQYAHAARYLAALLGAPPSPVGFEPDTFGHSAAMPMILRQAGARYYYFCRGAGAPANLFRWRAPDGSQVIACQEPQWYDSRIESGMALFVPEFCRKNGVDWALKVYGVGDHGGGPTRRDLRRVREMAGWPLFPTVRFGRYSEYFEHIAAAGDRLPLYEGELHSVFTGCLSSQLAVKQQNRRLEAALGEAAAFGAMAARADGVCAQERRLLNDGWETALFNQFHDILTGSCVPEVKHFALGRAQEAAACANTARAGALRRLAGRIDTRPLGLGGEGDDGFAFGAGAGIFVQKERRTGLPQQTGGGARAVHLFNPSAFARREVCEVLLWDWRGDTSRLRVRAPSGEALPCEASEAGFCEEWGHHYLRLFVLCEAPALGYTTLLIDEGDIARPGAARRRLNYPLEAENRIPTEREDDLVLENERLRARFSGGLALASLVDKASGRELVRGPAGVFELVEEDGYDGGGNAWLVGRTVRREAIGGFRLVSARTGGDRLRQSLRFTGDFGASRLEVEVSLERGQARLCYDIALDWGEPFGEGHPVKRLQFAVPLGYGCERAVFDIPFGHIARPEMPQNVAGCRFALAEPQGAGPALLLASADTYGYRFAESALRLTLLRASDAPDPCPEQGRRRLRLALCALPQGEGRLGAHRHSEALCAPLVEVPASAQAEGTLPMRHSFFDIAASHTALCSLEAGGEGEILLRLLEVDGRPERLEIRCGAAVARARTVDLLGREAQDGPAPSVSGDTVAVELAAHAVCTLALKLEEGTPCH